MIRRWQSSDNETQFSSERSSLRSHRNVTSPLYRPLICIVFQQEQTGICGPSAIDLLPSLPAQRPTGWSVRRFVNWLPAWVAAPGSGQATAGRHSRCRAPAPPLNSRERTTFLPPLLVRRVRHAGVREQDAGAGAGTLVYVGRFTASDGAMPDEPRQVVRSLCGQGS